MHRNAKIAIALLTPVVLLAVGVAGVLYSSFAGLEPVVATTAGPVEQIPIGYGSIGLIRLPNDRVALIDCGEAPDDAADALAERGIATDQVRTIFLTHGHRDHVGGCARFDRAKIYAGSDELPLLQGKENYKGPLTRWFTNDAQPFEAQSVDGHLLLLGPLRVKPYVIAGHTPGSVAYQIGDVLYFGDAAVGMADGTASTGPWIFNDDSDENRRSIRGLARSFTEKTRPTTLLFSHSGPVEGKAGLDALARLPE